MDRCQPVETSHRARQESRNAATRPPHHNAANHSHCCRFSVRGLMGGLPPEQIVAKARVREHHRQQDGGTHEEK